MRDRVRSPRNDPADTPKTLFPAFRDPRDRRKWGAKSRCRHGDDRYQPHIHRATEAAITDGRSRSMRPKKPRATRPSRVPLRV